VFTFSMEIKEWSENPHYKEDMKRWEIDRKYGRNDFGERPSEYIEGKALITRISLEQFEAIRKEILKVF